MTRVAFQFLFKSQWLDIRQESVHELLEQVVGAKLDEQPEGTKYTVSISKRTYTVVKTSQFYLQADGDEATRYYLRFKYDHKNRTSHEIFEIMQCMFWLAMQKDKLVVILKELMPVVFTSYLSKEEPAFERERKRIDSLLLGGGPFKLHPVMLDNISARCDF